MLRVLGDVIQNRLDLASQYMGHAKEPTMIIEHERCSKRCPSPTTRHVSEKFLRGTIIITYSKQTNRYLYKICIPCLKGVDLHLNEFGGSLVPSLFFGLFFFVKFAH